MRHLFFLVMIVSFIGCKPQIDQPNPQEDDLIDQPDLPVDLPKVDPQVQIVQSDLDEFQMAPPSFVQEYDERRMGKFFWTKCLPPYKGNFVPIVGEYPSLKHTELLLIIPNYRQNHQAQALR